MEKQGFVLQVYRSSVLTCRCAEARCRWACAEAGYCWASMYKHGIAGQVCSISVFLGNCAEAGNCWASVQKHGIAGQVCSFSVLLGKFVEAGY